jgi:transcription elongation GreA/GreB family factor
MEHEEERLKIQLIANFAQSQQLLFANYLGMKAAQLSYQEFNIRLKEGNLKKLANAQPLTSVFDQTVKGLAKIAENQKQARLQAAEKAKAEAEQLLEDRRKAEELSQQRAQEIAERTKQLLAKRADKERLEKENAVAQLIRAFNLGAWISIKEAGEPQRFKLVVKLAAMGKYVFVDRLGIKKREFMEADLVQALLSKEVEILSDGTEFEESLERVVSRIRMSK